MRTFAHVINPVIKPDGHELAIAQPATFESMRVARDGAAVPGDVELWAVTYPEDQSLVPPWFRQIPLGERSFRDIHQVTDAPKLPRIADILAPVAVSSQSDYLIYSNVDIGVMPFFYDALDLLLDEGWDSIIINRRTIHSSAPIREKLVALWMLAGDPHPGYDCFVFPRSWFSDLELGELCVGLPGFDWLLAVNIWVRSQRNYTFLDAHLTFHIGDDMTWRSERYQQLVKLNLKGMPEPLQKLRSIYGDQYNLVWPRPQRRKRNIIVRGLNRLGRELVKRFPTSQ